MTQLLAAFERIIAEPLLPPFQMCGSAKRSELDRQYGQDARHGVENQPAEEGGQQRDPEIRRRSGRGRQQRSVVEAMHTALRAKVLAVSTSAAGARSESNPFSSEVSTID